MALHLMLLCASDIVWLYILVYISYAAVVVYKMIPSKIPLVFFLQRAPPRKFYVMRQAVTIGCQTYRRSHTVGVSHVAQALRGGYCGEPSICRYGLGTRRPKGRAWVTELLWLTIVYPWSCAAGSDDEGWCNGWGSCNRLNDQKGCSFEWEFG